ncbi:MAG: IS630 family transposase, partial [Gammaproteobacteria bacterium CG22_combo_CG10-13_8_21_14_all_40_8]
MNIKNVVDLSKEEKQELVTLTSKGKASARQLKRANILLMSDNGKQTQEIAESLSVSTSTIYRTKKKFVDYGLEEALNEGKRPDFPRKLDANQEALLISLACTKPPKGCARWTLSLIADQFVSLSDVEPVSVETIRRRFKENDLKPWQRKMWCVGKMNTDYVAQMEHILDLYAKPANDAEPVVNFDEAMKQLVADITPPTRAKPGQAERQDYEYKRVSVANIFMFFDRHRGWRKSKATISKKAIDFAQCMKELVDEHYPDAHKIHVVMDNYGTHKPGSLYKAFKPEEALRILKRLEFHFTPKHASWLNMVEIEIGNMNQQCLDRRIADWETLHQELNAWETKRNDAGASINWMFNVDGAREKLTKA